MIHYLRSVIAAAAFTRDVAPPARFQWAPAGLHEIVCNHDSGLPCHIWVEVEATAVERVQASFERMLAEFPQRRPYGDFSHDRHQACMWPERFEWEPTTGTGIYVVGAWTESGISAVKGGDYAAWSPTFATDADYSRATERDGTIEFPAGARGSKSNPARITAVGFDIGGLTNEPAFTHISPVRANRPQTTGGQPAKPQETQMKVKILRAFGGYAEGQIVELSGDALVAALECGDAVSLKLADRLQASSASVNDVKEQNKQLRATIVKSAITRAKDRFAIAPKAGDDDAMIVRANRIAAADLDAAVEYLDGLPENPELRAAAPKGRQSASPTGELIVADQGLLEHAKGFARAKAGIPQMVRASNLKDAAEASKVAGLIYSNHLRAALRKEDVLVRDLMRAATTTDANVGYLAGDLVLQETLEFLQNFLPLFDQVTTSFRAEAIEYGQTVIAHYLGVPDVLTYSQTTGWGTSKAANAASTPSATGAPVAISSYKGVEVRFTATQIGGTVRNLFREQVGPSAYALAQDVIQAWVALITAANFTGASLSVALADFKASYFATLGKTLDDIGIARMPGARTAVLHTDYTNKLFEDADLRTTATLAAAYRGQQTSMLETGDLPPINGIKPIGTQEMSLNGAAKRVGFLFGKSATCIATRLMADWTQIFPDVPASAAVTVATHPETGLSMMLTRYTDAQLETGNQRMSLAYGVAKGQAAAGRLIVKP